MNLFAAWHRLSCRLHSGLVQLFFADGLPKGNKAQWAPSDFAPLEEPLARAACSESVAPLLAAPPAQLGRTLISYLHRERTRALGQLAIRLVCSLSCPVFLHALLQDLQKMGSAAEPGAADLGLGAAWPYNLLALAVAFSLSSLGASLAMQHYFNTTLLANQKITSLLSRAVYQAALGLRNAAYPSGPKKGGDLVNLMSSDAETVANLPMLLGDLCFAALTIGCGMAMLFYFVGPSALAGLTVFVLLVPLGRFLGRRFLAAEKQIMESKDKRVEALQQVVNTIRVIKCFCWEPLALRQIAGLRATEAHWLGKVVRLEGLATFLFVGSAYLAAALTFGVQYATEGGLKAATVFTALALFRLIEQPFAQLTVDFSGILNARVSLNRIGTFLRDARLSAQAPEAHDTTPQAHRPRPQDIAPHRPQLPSLVRAAVPQSGESTNWRLDHITLELQHGQAIAVVGPVGAGKSSLLLALLGELPLSPSMRPTPSQREPRQLRIAYVPQESYVRNGSLSDNITFHAAPTEQNNLMDSVSASGLLPDLLQLAGSPDQGLDLEIGENGVNLSGGQRARLNLARADFVNADLVLLDDPFAALDPAVEDLVSQNLVFGRWKGKTRVVVTHRLSQLPHFDRIIFMAGGQIRADGSYAELSHHCPEFAAFLKMHHETLAAAKGPLAQHGTVDPDASATSDSHPHSAAPQSIPPNHSVANNDEERETGKVATRLYRAFGSALAGHDRWRVGRACLLGGLALTAALAPMAQNLKLAGMDFVSGAGMGSSLLIYAALGLVAVLLTIAHTVYWRSRAVGAANTMHDRAAERLLASPLRFFDANPSGRIVNRFASDVAALETPLAWAADGAARTICIVLTSLLLLVIHVPMALLLVAPASLLFWNSQQRYRAVARDAKRLESLSRSPRYAHFKETLAGLEVIRAFDVQGACAEVFAGHLTRHMHVLRASFRANRWLAARVSLLSAGLSLAIAVFVALAGASGHMMAATAGLLLIYSVNFWESLNWAVRSFSELEARMTSFERLSRYGSLAVEAQTVALSEAAHRGGHPGAAQPESLEGTALVTFDNVWLRYAPHLPFVVKGVSLVVRPGERVGLVGRTGSGKSSLFQALFRFTLPEQGRILWKGHDVRSIPLGSLRRNFALVAQDPLLLPTTIRENLDPEGTADEASIWQALEHVTLKQWVLSLPQGLDHRVAEGGGRTFSQGQRQLLCLARAIIRRAELLLLDEATASVDVVTDRLIGRIIRTALPGSAVLAIAHRLGTLEGFDTVVTLEAGTVTHVDSRRPVTDPFTRLFAPETPRCTETPTTPKEGPRPC